MGLSASSQLDESKCTYIRGKTEAVISNFSPHYRRQYAVALFHQIQNEVEQHRDPQARFLKSKPPSEQGTVLYEGDNLLYAEDLKKWKERYVVIKRDYTVACFENKEAYQKGTNPKNRILPTGGKVLTSEEEYNVVSDKQFPDPIATNEKESSQPFIVVPSQFPVYLWQPYTRHSFFCFQDAESQKNFGAILDDCIRHQNHDFLKQTSIDAQAFSEALQFFRQEKSQYGSWEMITGSQTQILSNLVMEELLPTLQTDLLPKMKGRRNDRKRAWFGTVEETYNLVMAQVSEGFQSLQEECKNLAKQLEGTIRSDMDQIVTSKEFVAGKIKATVLEQAEKCCTENIRPFLASILEEIMGPVSSGFSEVRQLFEREIDAISQSFQTDNDPEKLKESLEQLGKLSSSSVKMEPCYLKVNLLHEQLQELKRRFKFYHIDLVVQRAQNDMQELMENAVYTFDQLLSHASKGDSQKMSTAIEKVKLRVLKQYDYDSSTVRKKIFQDALVLITMPTMQRTLASTCKPELQTFEQYIFADYTNLIQVENVYEEILFGKLLEETIKVIQEAASLKKHNLYDDSARLASESVSSLTDLKTPSGSAPASPERKQEQVVQKTVGTLGETNEVFIESKSTLSEEVKTGTSPSHVEEPVERKSPEKVLKAEPLGKEGCLPTVENIIIANITDKPESPVVTVKHEDLLPVEQTEGKTREEWHHQEEAPNDAAVGNISEIRSLLTVTIEVPPDTSHQSIQNVISEGRIVQIEEGEEQSEKKENIEESKNAESAIEQMEHLELNEKHLELNEKHLELNEKQCEVHLEAESVSSVTTTAVESSIGHLVDVMVTGEVDVQDEKEKDVEQCGIGLDVESANSVIITEAERAIIQLDNVMDTGEVDKQEEHRKEVAVGQTIESTELGSIPICHIEESVHHVESISKNEEIETVSVLPAANNASPQEAAEGTNTGGEAVSTDAVGAPDEGPPGVHAMLQEEQSPEQVTSDDMSKHLAEAPSDHSRQSGKDASVSLEFSNSSESAMRENNTSTCTEHMVESSVTE